MAYALIEEGVVLQLWLPENAPNGYVAVPDFVQPGYLFDGSTFTAPAPEPEPVPSAISDRQFFHVLATEGLITETEALTAVKTGDPPAAFENFIASLPDNERFSARMLLEGATTFRRDHPLTAAFGTMYGMTSEQIDDLWRRASVL